MSQIFKTCSIWMSKDKFKFLKVLKGVIELEFYLHDYNSLTRFSPVFHLTNYSFDLSNNWFLYKM